MYPVKSKGVFGVFNGHDWLIAPKYKWIDYFQCGFAYARTIGGVECLIEANGSQIALRDISNSVAPADVVSCVRPDDASNSPGSLIVKSANGQTVLLLDHQLQPRPIDTFPCNCNLAVYFVGDWLVTRVSQGLKRQFVLFHSERVVRLDGFKDVVPPSDDSNLIAVKSDDPPGRWAYYSFDQGRIVSDWFHFAAPFSDGLGLIERDVVTPCKFLNSQMEKVSGLEFEWADVFRFGLAAGVKDGVSGYYDRKGVCQFQCDGERHRFNRIGHAIVEREIREPNCEIVDRTGKSLISDLESCTFFDGDFPCYDVARDGKDAIITEDLETIPREII